MFGGLCVVWFLGWIMDNILMDWCVCLCDVEVVLNDVVLGQQWIICLLLILVLCWGYVLLVGDVGIGKIMLLCVVVCVLGGFYVWIEGMVDLLLIDLIYLVYIVEDGCLCIDFGLVLEQGEDLVVFFFNEINCVWFQVYVLLLWLMVECSLIVFWCDWYFLYFQVFVDCNQIECDEMFELFVVVCDCFLMEIVVDVFVDMDDCVVLVFDLCFYDMMVLIVGIVLLLFYCVFGDLVV